MQAASRRVREVEERLDLLRHRRGRWSSWSVIRSGVVRRVMRMPLDAAPPSTAAARWRRLRHAVGDAGRFPWLRRSPVLVKTSVSARGDLDGGRSKDVYFDDLIRHLGGAVKIEDDNQATRDLAPPLIPADLTSTLISMTAERMARRSPPDGTLEQSALFSRILRDELEVDVSEERIASRLSEFWWMRAGYGRLLGVVRPRVVLTMDPEVALVAAARERGIAAIELQHGVLTRDYISYSYGPYASAYRGSLPVPDRFLTYGPYWTDEMKATGFWGDEVRTTGSISLDAHRSQPPRTTAAIYRIVVTAQGTDTARLIDFLRAFVRALDDRLAYELAIKLHPIYDTSKEVWVDAFAAFPCVTVRGREASVYELLSAADLHMSIFSTCHYEAIGLGVATAVVPLYDHEVVLHLVDEGSAILAENPADLADRVVNRRPSSPPPWARDKYFASNALANVAGELEAVQCGRERPAC